MVIRRVVSVFRNSLKTYVGFVREEKSDIDDAQARENVHEENELGPSRVDGQIATEVVCSCFEDVAHGGLPFMTRLGTRPSRCIRERT